MNGRRPPRPSRTGLVVGRLLMVLGVLWMLLAGGCTVLGALYALADVASGPDGLFNVAVAGGVGIVMGLMLFFGGREMALRGRGIDPDGRSRSDGQH